MSALHPLIKYGQDWFRAQSWTPFPFQLDTWQAFLEGKSGLVNAPTGSGKTYSLMIPAILEGIDKPASGLQLIWVTPIRALAKEIFLAASRAIEEMDSSWTVELRTGDTTPSDRQKQWKNPPQILITTPESIHVMLAMKDHKNFFKNLNSIVVDEWHELIGSKRGVQVELALSYFKATLPSLRVWGISATIGNMEEAIQVLHSDKTAECVLIKADIPKIIEVISIMPDEIEKFPWAGHIGIHLLHKVLDIIKQSKSVLIFTNTRAQCEIWYQRLLAEDGDLAGIMAMHHGSISKDLRSWVEDALHDGTLKAVVCTSSLDLGVDFRPVDSIVQIGSPKGVARFIQRAGRSGHQPGAISKIYFLPTHALELIEAAAMRTAIEDQSLEERIPYVRSFDVLIQYMMTLAVSDGFLPQKLYQEIKNTFSFQSITSDEWQQLLSYLVYGGKSLSAYDEYQKIEIENGLYKVTDRKVAMRHRLSIGTIVSEVMIAIKYVKGKYIGSVEEWFVSQLMPGDIFWFAGRSLELVRFKDLTAQVIDSKSQKGKVPSYMGGRLPLSSQLTKVLRTKLDQYIHGVFEDDEIVKLCPLLDLQKERSHVPQEDELLVEYLHTEEGYHLSIYPYEGRNVHEGLAVLIAKRISNHLPISFTIAMNDYGFELTSDSPIEVHKLITHALFSTNGLIEDISASINAVEMAKRRFRDIATISGLIFQGYPGKQKKDRHLHASAQLLFNVFHEYEPDNMLYLQTYEEVRTFQLEESRMRDALMRIQHQKIIIKLLDKPSPFSFPIMVDRLREKLSSEKLEDRIKKMSFA
jgi:ATP-dependent helicase Lhr and Lhr-like helicase